MDLPLIEGVFPLALVLLLAAAIPAVFMALSSVLGPRRDNENKGLPYECGIPAPQVTGDARSRFNVKFYLTAMCFLVFDVEVVFLFPWAVWFQDKALFGAFVLCGFLGPLVFGWWYLLKRGGLEWD